MGHRRTSGLCGWPHGRRLFEVGLAALLLVATVLPLWGTYDVWGAGPGQAPSRLLRVVTKPIEPFVTKRGDEWVGFSIDVWDEIARRLKLSCEWVGVASVGDQHRGQWGVPRQRDLGAGETLHDHSLVFRRSRPDRPVHGHRRFFANG